MGVCSSVPDAPPGSQHGDDLDVKPHDPERATGKTVNYQFKLALIGDSMQFISFLPARGISGPRLVFRSISPAFALVSIFNPYQILTLLILLCLYSLLLPTGGVGKTSVRRCYMGDEFRSESLLSTVGVDWDTKQITVDGVNVTMKIWVCICT